jgi:adenosylcobinamide-phosphate guanylyltransferase
MCGGRGTRLDAPVEKPLFEIGDEAMVDHVADALTESAVGSVTAAVSPHTSETREHLSARDDLAVVETPGKGYVADLDEALDSVETPAVTVVADLPLLDATVVDRVLAVAREIPGALSVSVPTAVKRELGASVDIEQDGRAPSGCNVVTAPADDTPETMYTSYDARLAVNVNRRSDAQLAERLLDESAAREPLCE